MTTSIDNNTQRLRLAIGRCFILVLLALSLNSAHAVIDNAPSFDNDAQQAQYTELVTVVRCPTCQNQNISESNAALARQLREIVIRDIHAGKNNDEIIDFLIERYGDFITYKPPFKASTWVLWLGPAAVMLIMLALWLLWRRPQQTPALSAEEQQDLSAMLDKYRDHS